MELATPRPQNVTGRRDEPARMAAAPRSEMLMTDRGPCTQIRVVGTGFGTRGHADERAYLGDDAESIQRKRGSPRLALVSCIRRCRVGRWGNVMERRVFVSAISNATLDERRRELKAAIIRKIRDTGYAPQEFFETGIAADLSWTFDNVENVMRRCIGAAIICFPRWVVPDKGQPLGLVSGFQHYEGAVAATLGLPLMIFAEEGLENRGIVWEGGRGAIHRFPSEATANWVESPEFTTRFAAWCHTLTVRRDIFLGYCSESAGMAAQIQLLLERHGATVRNWEMDFRFGASILDELEAARRACSCGIFLFSEDDPLQGRKGGAAPRDNVVFEAGHFISSKGTERCLIIRVGDAKMPADLGGAIYVSLGKTEKVAAIEGKLAQFLERNV